MIRDKLLSNENLYLAAVRATSYISNRELLDEVDQKRLLRMKDIYDEGLYSTIIDEVHSRLTECLDKDKYLSASVYFKPKKYDKESNKIVYRPLHTAPLIDQIAMVALLHMLVYEFNSDGKLIPSELSKLLPANFYGNRIDYEGEGLFKPWNEQYLKYTTKANELLKEYSETGKMEYEVTLDLVDFFPSVNPKILYKFISKRKSLRVMGDDVETFNIILTLLLFFDLDIDCFTEEEKDIYFKDQPHCHYTKGIPQGLPHSYFLANMFMLLVKRVYSKSFPGEMLFYVDDSVIFTNAEIDNADKFKKAVDDVNNNLIEVTEPYCRGRFNLPKGYKFEDEKFKVEVHPAEANGKSYYLSLKEAKQNNSILYLHGLGRETSKLGFDIFSMYSDDEVSIMEKRTKGILEFLESEIKKVNDSANKLNNDSYLKRLYRYRKFFKLRSMRLSYQTGELTYDKLFEKLNNDFIAPALGDNDIETRRENFFATYSDDIFSSACNTAFMKAIEKHDDSRINSLYVDIERIDMELLGNLDHSYLIKAFQHYLKSNIQEEVTKYGTLSYRVKNYYRYATRMQFNERTKEFLRIINEEDSMRTIYSNLGLQKLYQISSWCNKRHYLNKGIINCLFSTIYSFSVTDSLEFSKTSRDVITYFEMRALVKIRCDRFDLSSLSSYLTNENNYHDYRIDADYLLLKVMDIFRSFVFTPKLIDNLILIHKYCCDTWKNGSKYLYFYTLHNQEHAVALIRNIVILVHSLSYFNLGHFDYYLLFASCYLHDISMVSIPDYDVFIKDAFKADEIYNKLINDENIKNRGGEPFKIKKSIIESYKAIDDFFETAVRGNHAVASANEILTHSELKFIGKAELELIAQISKAHGMDAATIYNMRSNNKHYNLKSAMILLRLADLLDMSRYRISEVILHHNINTLGTESRFHWLSHLMTDRCEITTNYVYDSVNAQITENLVISIYVLFSQMTPMKNKRECNYIEKIDMEFADVFDCAPQDNTTNDERKGHDSIKIEVSDALSCKCDKKECSFLCCWFMEKNAMLINELHYLKRHLNTHAKDYFYKSGIDTVVEVDNTLSPALSSDISIYEMLQNYIDEKYNKDTSK